MPRNHAVSGGQRCLGMNVRGDILRGGGGTTMPTTTVYIIINDALFYYIIMHFNSYSV